MYYVSYKIGGKTLYFRTRHFGFPEYTPELKKAKGFKTYDEAAEEKRYLGGQTKIVLLKDHD